MNIFLIISGLLNLLLLVGLGFAGYYLWRFSQIIMLLEDDFSDAIEGLELVEQSLDKLLKMQLFFDSKEVKLAVQEVMGEVKAGRIAVNRLIQKFVDRSKQKYVVIQEEELPMPPPPAPPAIPGDMSNSNMSVVPDNFSSMRRMPDPSMVDVRFMSSTNRQE